MNVRVKRKGGGENHLILLVKFDIGTSEGNENGKRN